MAIKEVSIDGRIQNSIMNLRNPAEKKRIKYPLKNCPSDSQHGPTSTGTGSGLLAWTVFPIFLVLRAYDRGLVFRTRGRRISGVIDQERIKMD
jgi:hypothetical protein